MKNRGFTLIEMLVVISIIAILAAILMPAIAAVRRSAKMAASTSLLRTVGMALEHYSSDFSGFYPPDTVNSTPLAVKLDGGTLDCSAQALCYFIESEFISDDGRKSGTYENFKAANKYYRDDSSYQDTYPYPDPNVTLKQRWNYVVDAFRTPLVYDERKSERDSDGLNAESFVLISGGAFDKDSGVNILNIDAGATMFDPYEQARLDSTIDAADSYNNKIPGTSASNDDLYNM